MFFITLATNFRRVALISIFFIYKLPQKWQNEIHYLQWGWMSINTSFPPYTFYIKGYLFGVIPDPRYSKNLNWLHNLMIKLSLYFWNSYYCNTAYFSWIFLWKLLLLWNKCQWLYNWLTYGCPYVHYCHCPFDSGPAPDVRCPDDCPGPYDSRVTHGHVRDSHVTRDHVRDWRRGVYCEPSRFGNCGPRAAAPVAPCDSPPPCKTKMQMGEVIRIELLVSWNHRYILIGNFATFSYKSLKPVLGGSY